MVLGAALQVVDVGAHAEVPALVAAETEAEAAQAARRDYTVDWVHLKINDNTQRTVLCKDPFRSVDERVDRLIASL